MLKQGQIDFDNPHFYDTAAVPNREEMEVKAISLEKYILEKVFKPGLELDPYDVMDALKKLERPAKENSVRRALTNLKDPKKWEKGLVLTGKQKLSSYSTVPNATYKLK